MTIIGIDPGLSGAVAVLNGLTSTIHDMPVFTIKANGKERRNLDIAGLIRIIQDTEAVYAFIEKVGVMPGEGSVGAFKFGYTCGAIEAVILAAKIPFSYVTPQVWKKALQCPKDKDGARMRAGQLLPEMSHHWPLKKHDGRAEAALIALYGKRQLGNDKTALPEPPKIENSGAPPLDF